MLLCKFCGRECKNTNSLGNHIIWCKLNPNKKVRNWNNGGNRGNQFTKAKSLGLKIEVSEETRKKISASNFSRTSEWNKENGKKISESIQKRVDVGTWHTSLAKHMHIDYNGVDLHGSWELKYAQYLDSNNIRWIRNKDSFSYYFEGKDRKYTPDFYLPETDEYIEIKGYKTKKDEAKWSQFPPNRKLIVLLGEDLKRLGII